MQEIFQISLIKSNNTEFGVKKQGDEYIFTCAFDVSRSLELIIMDMEEEIEISIPMNEFNYAGNVYSVAVKGLAFDKFKYYYICDDKYCTDPYIIAREKDRAYGKTYAEAFTSEDKYIKKACFPLPEYDFSDDLRPMLNQADVIAYELHVRGFTKHSSSKVKGKGCFLGIIEKIPYFTELNINQIELMPAYDFYEFDIDENSPVNYQFKPSTYINESGQTVKSIPKEKLNYWGYKKADYFCPKYEYSYSKDAVTEFKDMVKALHKAGIELIMQMYYPQDTKQSVIIDSLRYWYTQYNVDGFHVMGQRVPVELILSDDILLKAKFYINNINRDDSIVNSLTKDRNVIDINDGFMVSMRRFLKGDNDSLNGFVYSNRQNSSVNKTLNFITKYEGFTLNDLVSYEHKHNELNGENNADGINSNFSWNCGIEGKSSKKSVKELRIKQIKNALCLLLLSQGTPMLFMGDELMNTQNGNNNPYCQDNEITWLNWKLNKAGEEVFAFTKMLTTFRKNNKILHQDNELKNADYYQTGNPDISYHQDMAWKADLNGYMLHLGIMLEGKYAKPDADKPADSQASDTLYIAYNMHWENHMFGLPRLKAPMKWEVLFSTCEDKLTEEMSSDLNKSQEELCVYNRSVVVLRELLNQ